MTLLGFGSFDGGHSFADGASSQGGTPTLDATIAYGGGVSLKCIANNDTVTIPIPGVVGRWYYFSFWFRKSANPTIAGVIANTAFGAQSGGGLSFGTDGSISAGSVTTGPLNNDQWYWITFGIRANSTVDRQYRLYLDGGALLGTRIVADATTNAPASITPGRISGGGTYSVWFDNWMLNDDQGASFNGPPDNTFRSVTLLPTGDSAIGANWKLGDGTSPSSNAFESVNNTPPVGVADPSSAGAQLKNSVNSTATPASDADFTMQTPTVGGVGSTETVRAAMVKGQHSRNAATNISGTYSGVSNPAISGLTTSASQTALTWPSRWFYAPSDIAINPSVTYGTAPVVRVHKATASTTAAMVCYMGLALLLETPRQTLIPPLLDSTPTLYAPTVTQIEDNDPGTIDDPITGTVYINGETVRSVEEVQLFVSHPNTSHLLVTLKPPDGSPEVTLFDHRGSGADIGASSGSPLILRDDAATTLASSFTSGTGMTRKPESPLSTFHNESGGTWVITVTDTTTGLSVDLPYARIDSKGPVAQKKVLKLKLYTFNPTLYPPSVVSSSQTLVVPLLDSSPTLYAPTVIPNTYFLVLPLLTVSPDLYAPSVVPGTVHLVLPLLDTAPDLYPPYLDPRAVQLVVPLLTVDPDLYAPTVTPGRVTLTVPLLTVTPDLYAPAVNPRQVEVLLPLLTVDPELYTPVVSAGAVHLVLPLLDVAPTLYPPKLRFRLLLPLLTVDPVLLAPRLVLRAVVLHAPLLDSPYELFPPTLIRRVWKSRPGHQELHGVAGTRTGNQPGHKEKMNAAGEVVEVIN